MGSIWPHGTVNVTFFHGTTAGLISQPDWAGSFIDSPLSLVEVVPIQFLDPMGKTNFIFFRSGY